MKTLREKKHEHFVCVMYEVRKKKEQQNKQNVFSFLYKMVNLLIQFSK